MSNNSHKLMALIAALYLSQGVPMGLAFVALPAILRSFGTSPEMIGLLGVVILPWAIKFIWAPYVDRLKGGPFGPRRSWIIPTQILCGLLFFILALFVSQSVSGVPFIIAIIFVINTVSATQDIATDGLAVDCFKGKQIARVNGWQIAAFTIGMALGGSVTLLLYDNGGWHLAFFTLGIIMLAPVFLTFFVKEPRVAALEHESTPKNKATLRQTWRRPGAIAMILVAALFQSAHAMINAMSGPFFVDAGLSLSEIGTLAGAAMTVFAVIGALTGSYIAARIGAHLTAMIAGTIAALTLTLWLWPAQTMALTFHQALFITACISIFVFAAYAAFFTVFMQWASPNQAGTDFTVLQCTETFFGGLAAMLAGQLVGLLGFYAFFFITTAIALIAMAWISFSFVKQGYLRRTSHPAKKTPSSEGDMQNA